MAEKIDAYFMGRFICNFLHRQETTRPVVFRSEDIVRIWIEYVTDMDSADFATNQKSVCCVYKKTKLRADFRNELLQAHTESRLDDGVAFVVDPTKRHQTPLVFPSNLSDACEGRISQIEKDISEQADVFISNLRWRLNLSGPGKTFVCSKLIWSENGETWSSVPRKLVAFPDIQRDLISANITKEIASVAINLERKEPIAQVLIRDAWTLHLRDHRGALMHAVTALEVGVKSCIARLVPDAAFLVQELPSPPVLLLLQEYLPELFQKRTNATLTLPSQIIEKIKRIVHQRNLLVHRGICTVPAEVVRDYIEAIHDVLYLLDYASGDKWAIAIVSPEISQHVLGSNGEYIAIDPVATLPMPEATNNPMDRSGGSAAN